MAVLQIKLHVENVFTKYADRLSLLYRNSYLLDFSSREVLCSSLIQLQIRTAFQPGTIVNADMKNMLDLILRNMRSLVAVDSYEILRFSWLSRKIRSSLPCF